MAVGGKGARLDEELAAFTARAVKGREHQMQVDGEGVHRHHFVVGRANEFRKPGTEVFMVRNPRTMRRLVTARTERCPVVELRAHEGARSLGHESKRVAGEVEERLAVSIVR